MSRVAKKPIEIPAGVTVDIKGSTVAVKGPLGEDSMTLLDGISLKMENNILSVVADYDGGDKKIIASGGLIRALLNNIVVGVSKGFTKELEIVGVGYRATQQSKDVQFQLGYSHPIVFSPPAGVQLEVLEPTKVRVKGINKQQVGQVAANIRELRPPEPYKGKGIKYKDETIRKKAGKTGK
ncbi:MAG: 50S ribosomal protein L6 [Spirochaetes bacterium]|nr:50S ribosomal protein L6 [Spirochaetota bacterium]